MTSIPRVDINLEALCHNFRALAHATPQAKPSAVVKCDAYGLGLIPVSRALAIKEQCDTFFVAHTSTGKRLRNALSDIAPDATIFILNGPGQDTIDDFHQATLTPILNSHEQVALWAKRFPKIKAAIHFDTGMNRLGLPPDFAKEYADKKDLNIKMIMSHFSCASNPGAPTLAKQHAAFKNLCEYFPNAQRSLASTGGALMNAEYGFDLTRLGVGLYGVGPYTGSHEKIKPVARLTAPVIQLRQIDTGESAGYDCTFTASRKTHLATVALGYGDGFPRAGSNQATAYLGNKQCPIVGRISMDLIIIDVTETVSPVKVGDFAEFFGEQVLIEDAAAKCGTIGYELLTSLGSRIEKRYFWGDKPAEIEMMARDERGTIER